MSKQDKTYSRTPEDLERKYNLGQLAQGGSSQGGGDNGKISQALQEIANCKATINTMLAKIKEIESEIGEGGGSNEVYLTKAEYNALPDSKLSDNVEYRITDANTSNTFASTDVAYGSGTVKDALDSLSERLTVYSTEEKVVGTWIDGRPIYERSIHLPTITTDNNGGAVITLFNDNIDSYSFFSAEGGQLYTSGSTKDWFHLGYNYFSSSVQIVRITSSHNVGVHLRISGYTNGLVSNGNYVVRYMKTTDK